MAESSRYVLVAIEEPVIQADPSCYDTCVPERLADTTADIAATSYVAGSELGYVPRIGDDISVQARLTCEGGRIDAGTGRLVCAASVSCVLTKMRGEDGGEPPVEPTGPAYFV
jgi:hypothetical protein